MKKIALTTILVLIYATLGFAATPEEINAKATLARNGDTQAGYELGLMYMQGKEIPRDAGLAARWFSAAAAYGHAEAQYELALCYAKGLGLTRDYEQAFAWYQEAALQGLPKAQYAVGVYLENGEYVTQNLNFAVQWFELAAKQGYAPAQARLGFMYYQGYGGIQRNYETAAAWLYKAAQQNDHSSQTMLAYLYHSGNGVPLDYVQAYMYYKLASYSPMAETREAALDGIKTVKKGMTKGQIARAEDMALEWRKKNTHPSN